MASRDIRKLYSSAGLRNSRALHFQFHSGLVVLKPLSGIALKLSFLSPYLEWPRQTAMIVTAGGRKLGRKLPSLTPLDLK